MAPLTSMLTSSPALNKMMHDLCADKLQRSDRLSTLKIKERKLWHKIKYGDFDDEVPVEAYLDKLDKIRDEIAQIKNRLV